MKLSKFTTTRRAGFTLIEMILVLSIFALLSGSVLMVVRSMTQFSESLMLEHQDTKKNEDFENYIAYLIENIDDRATINLEPSTGSGLQSMSVQGVHIYFPYDDRDVSAQEISIDPSINANGLIDLQVSFFNEVISAKEAASAITLVSNLNAIEWQFFDGVAKEWITEWARRGGAMPKAIKLIYRQSKDDVPATLVIAL